VDPVSTADTTAETVLERRLVDRLGGERHVRARV
jgi:hypothetical protein